MKKVSLQDVWGTRLLVADGATGTVLDALLAAEAIGGHEQPPRDYLPLLRPDLNLAVHRAYLAAGADIIKTATFNANLLSLADLGDCEALSGSAFSLAAPEACLRLNRAAAALAAQAIQEAMLKDGRSRWIAGSVGPGTKAPSLGAVTYEELVESYLPQMLGLIDGGADLILIETVQDVLQCKAAVEALRQANSRRGTALPFVVSATVDSQACLLTGTTVEAFALIMAAFKPLALGLNCSGGPFELEVAFRRLAALCPVPLSFMPNAGMPQVVENSVVWPLAPDGFAQKTAVLAQVYGAALVGGCCGSNPESIALLVKACAAGMVPPDRPERKPALVSAVAPCPTAKLPYLHGGLPPAALLVIDERANASGSLRFRKVLKERGLPAAVDFVRDRAEESASQHQGAAIDICVAGYVADEIAAYDLLVTELNPVLPVAFSLDTLSNPVLAKVLPKLAGRPLVNSVNLENPDEARQRFRLARQFGAAVVCLCLDEKGPAKLPADKLRIAGRLYELALSEGLSGADLFIDVCTFPVASGSADFADSARHTLEAISRLPEVCPGAGSILGVGNVSFGLPKELRPAFTRCFLDRALQVGLTAAIVDPSLLDQPPGSEFAGLADAVIDNRADNALESLLAIQPPGSGGAGMQSRVSHEDLRQQLADLDPLAALSLAIDKAYRPHIDTQLSRAVAAGFAMQDLAAAISAVMAGIGQRFDRGELPLPLVLRSADCARAAFAALKTALAAPADSGQPVPVGAGVAAVPHIVLATVRGDLHDIGKNLVGMVFESAGFIVTDLGTDCSAEHIIQAAIRERADIVAVSGLLTKSLQEMAALAGAMQAAGLRLLLLCGGAAVQADYVETAIAGKLYAPARYAKDPFQAVSLVKAAFAASNGEQSFPPADTRPAAAPPGVDPSITEQKVADMVTPEPESRLKPIPKPESDVSPLQNPAFSAPYWGGRLLPGYSLDRLLAELDRPALLKSRWKYSSVTDPQAQADLQAAVDELCAFGLPGSKALGGFFSTLKNSDNSLLLTNPESGQTGRLPFPRRGRSLTDYYADADVAALLAVTLGSEAVKYLRAIHARGSSDAYLRAHGLLAGLAEAAVGLYHKDLVAVIKEPAGLPAGKRYSFGFPGCPGVEYNPVLLALLDSGRIGLSTTSTYQLSPEFSVTALLIPRSGLSYFEA